MIDREELLEKTSIISPKVIIGTAQREQLRRLTIVSISVIFILAISLYLIYKSTFWFIPNNSELIFKVIRFPRALVAFFVGSLLALSGHVLQITLENPLAEPYLLGASSGSALLLAIGQLLSLKYTPLLAVLGGVLAFLLVIIFSYPEMNPYTLILNGVVVSIVMWSATLGLLALFPNKLDNLFMYFLGSLTGKSLIDAKILAGIFLITIALLLLKASDIDLLALGRSIAATMGVNVKFVYWFLIAVAIISVSASVYYAGIIGFVGLIIPHLFRTLAPLPNKYFIPLLAVGGGTFMLLADWLAYTAFFPREIPVGIACAIIGAPVFLIVFRRMQKE